MREKIGTQCDGSPVLQEGTQVGKVTICDQKDPSQFHCDRGRNMQALGEVIHKVALGRGGLSTRMACYEVLIGLWWVCSTGAGEMG